MVSFLSLKSANLTVIDDLGMERKTIFKSLSAYSASLREIQCENLSKHK